MKPALEIRATPGARVFETEAQTWRLELPEGPAGTYRLAQLDDYGTLPRRAFHWRPPLRLTLRARVSAPDLPGTWGFGLWNDPFTASLGLGGTGRRLPAPPNAAWFFHASPPNHLALHDTHPVQGWLAATFAAPDISPWLRIFGLPALPLFFWPPTAPGLRRLAGRLIQDDAAQLETDPSVWHTYILEWRAGSVTFQVDETVRFVTPIAPAGPLGLVLWIDNQYAALPPAGRLRFGTLDNPAAFLELSPPEIETATDGLPAPPSAN